MKETTKHNRVLIFRFLFRLNRPEWKICATYEMSPFSHFMYICVVTCSSRQHRCLAHEVRRGWHRINEKLSSVLVRLPLENGIYSLWYEKKSKCIGHRNLWEKYEQSKQWRPTELTTYTHLNHIHSSIHPSIPIRIAYTCTNNSANIILLLATLYVVLSSSRSRFTFNRFSHHFSQTGASSIILLAFIHAYII